MPLTRWPPDSERAHEPLSEQWGGNARDLHTHKQSGLMEQEDGRFAFLTSAGAAGLAAVIAAVIAAGIAYHGLRTRLDGDRGLARDAQVTAVAAAQEVDARQRWREVLQWVWANKDPLNTADPLIAQRVLEALEGPAVTKP